MTKFQEELISMDVCDDAVVWIGDKTVEESWQTCERGDWMMWYAAIKNIDDRLLIAVATEHAKLVEHLMTDPRSINALRVGEMYGKGEATHDELKAARDAAYATDAYAYAAYTATVDDATVGTAAAYAAGTAGTADADTRKKILKQCADICRKMIPVELFNFDGSNVV